ncbi:hypothetical protein Tco_0940614 [Tanacetum coccineum]|uniref:Uncharacterized protein n=1 Tax=Tanacetum coccineum TaxID=301880 RepID=A0ABQ5DV83_9ASTR
MIKMNVENDEETGKGGGAPAPVDLLTVPTDGSYPLKLDTEAFETKSLLLYHPPLHTPNHLTLPKFCCTLPSSSPPPENVESLKDNIRLSYISASRGLTLLRTLAKRSLDTTPHLRDLPSRDATLNPTRRAPRTGPAYSQHRDIWL